MGKKRTDIHREGALIPSDYEYVLSYNLPTTFDGWPVPAYMVNCELDLRRTEADGKVVNGAHRPDGLCCVVGLRSVAKAKFATHGATGKCTACGTQFVYGDVWRHKPSGEHIHVGHICGQKMGLHADRTEYEQAFGRIRQKSLAELRRQWKAERSAAFLADNPGLKEALELDHHILRDLKDKLETYGDLSERQVALALKIANEVRGREAERETRIANARHLGEVGKRLEVTITCEFVASWEGLYGTQFLFAMRDEVTGARLVWRTSSLPDFHRGETARIRGTVKKHDEYQGEKQTVLSRVKTLEVVAKA